MSTHTHTHTETIRPGYTLHTTHLEETVDSLQIEPLELVDVYHVTIQQYQTIAHRLRGGGGLDQTMAAPPNTDYWQCVLRDRYPAS